VSPVRIEANINTFHTSISIGSPIDQDTQLRFLMTTWQDIFEGGSCKCARIWKELFGTRSGKSLFMADIEGIEFNVLTFVTTEEIHGNCQTKVAWANPREQICPTSSKDQ
jgi:hypothetical protein